MQLNVNFHSIEISNFLKFHQIQLPLNRVNLIAGRNASGKTSILDAIFICLGPANPQLWVNVLGRRGIFPTGIEDSSLNYLFEGLDVGKKITLRVKGEHNFEVELFTDRTSDATSLKYFDRTIKNDTNVQFDLSSTSIGAIPEKFVQVYRPELDAEQIFSGTIGPDQIKLDGDRKAVFHDAAYFSPIQEFYGNNTITRFSKVIESKQLDSLVDALHSINPEIRSLDLVVRNGRPLIIADLGFGVVPLSLVGNGAYRLVELLAAMSECRNGALLIDEAELSFHYSAYKNLWNSLLRYSQEVSCQLFVTSHSAEFISSGAKAAENSDLFDKFTYHRLDVLKDQTEVTSYSLNELLSSIDSEVEVR